jgi:hypothetical protein
MIKDNNIKRWYQRGMKAMKERYKVLFILVIVSYALAGCGPERYPIPSYPRSNQPPEITEKGNGRLAIITTRFSTKDSAEEVKQFYEQGLTDAGWSVELLPVAGVQPLPTLPTPESLLVHGNDGRGCPLYYVEVIIEPLEGTGANVTTISGAVPCY